METDTLDAGRATRLAGIRSTEAPPVVVHLVHGTWPYGLLGLLGRLVPGLGRRGASPWFEVGSDFWFDLARRVGCRVELRPFRWSGANSLCARLTAAQALRDELAQVRNSSLEEPCQLVIAHSHGGNVAVWGVTEPQTSWGQGHQSSPSDCFGVATLGTPFLHLGQRTSEPRHRNALGILQAATLLMFLWIAVRVSTLFAVGWTPAELVWPLEAPAFEWIWPGATNVREWLPGLLTSLVLGVGLFSIQAAMRLKHITMPSHKDERGPRTRLFEPSRVRDLLVLRAPGDEAGLALATAQVADLVLTPLRRCMRSIQPALTRLLTGPRVSLVLLLPLVLADPGLTAVLRYFLLEEPWSVATDSAVSDSIVPQLLDAGWQWLRPAVVAALPVAVAALAVLAVLGSLLLVAGVVLMPFGWELFSSGLLLSVTAEATPPGGAHAVETLSGDSRAGGLRHSMHEQAAVRERLAEWIDARYSDWLTRERGSST